MEKEEKRKSKKGLAVDDGHRAIRVVQRGDFVEPVGFHSGSSA